MTVGNGTNYQRGNVLFLILIAVALFAALAYAVTSSNRTSGGTISKDKAKAYAAQILQHAALIRATVSRLKIGNGCTDTTLNFTTSGYQTQSNGVLNPDYGNAPGTKICHLFDPAGGNLSPTLPTPDALTTPVLGSSQWKAGHIGFRVWQVKEIGTDDTAGTVSANDLLMNQQWLNRETCLAINDLVGVTNPGGEPPTTWTTSSSVYNGTMASSGIQDDPAFNGKHDFCMSTLPNYIFISVMVAR